MENTSIKNTATFTHLSTLTQYFIPFGNFIFPLVIWSSAKKDSDFVDKHGKQVINFQLSLMLYTIVIALIAIPILLFSIFKNVPAGDYFNGLEAHFENFNVGNITGLAIVGATAIFLWVLIKAAEFFLTIYASVKAANGEYYNYPFTIRFIK